MDVFGGITTVLKTVIGSSGEPSESNGKHQRAIAR
jgi:hypothetical protein